MGFAAKVILDSVGPAGQRLTTSQLTYPRFIHAEFMTHREFSRNASSSRAIPVAKMIEQVRTSPAMPIHWGANQPGMQARVEVSEDKKAELIYQWQEAAYRAADIAATMAAFGVHKQVANRLLEPFQWMHVIVTTASHTNFDGLRLHPDADPNIHHLAQVWKKARDESRPKLLRAGEWHLPYITGDDVIHAIRHLKRGRITRDEPSDEQVNHLLVQISAARCARVSYLTHDGQQPTIEKDLELYERLAGSQPIHASPLEHQATPDSFGGYDEHGNPNPEYHWANPELHGNLPGWQQFRKMHDGEYIHS